MPNGQRPCPICNTDADIQRLGNRLAFTIECRRCGKYAITEILLNVMPRLEGEERRLLPYLSAYTRQSSARGLVRELDTANWRNLADAHTKTSVSLKVSKLLEFVASRSSFPGERVRIYGELDYPLIDAASSAELSYFLSHLEGLDHVQRDGNHYFLTMKGWERLEPVKGGVVVGRCFVAMSFHENLHEAYELGIRPAVLECGFDPRRIDLVHHNEKICDKILAEIRLCQFVVADFTLQRAGVYFEAGFTMGLGRPVIWTCQEDDFANTHFDTRQYNHIVWATPNDLRTKVSERIRATISA